MKLKLLCLAAALVVGAVLANGVPGSEQALETVVTRNALYANAAKQTVLVRTPKSQGSAFMFKRLNDKGITRWFAWTAEHVVEGEQTVELVIHLRTEGRIVGTTVYTAKVLKAVPGLDIALLFVHAPKNAFVATEFADLAPAQQGDPVFTVGNFFGDDFPGSISIGVISQIGVDPKSWAVLDQSTAPVYPGSSGGPIFNSQGLVLGIVVARVDATLALFVPVRAIDEWASAQGYEWAVRGYSCPSDVKGKFLVAPVPPSTPPPPESRWSKDEDYWR